MGSPTIHKQVIDGFLVVVRPRRGYVEATVYDGESATDEVIGDWEMPNQLRRDLEAVAYTAVNQSRRESKRNKETEGDTA